MIPELILAGIIGAFVGWFSSRVYLKVREDRLQKKAVEEMSKGNLSEDSFMYNGKAVKLTTAHRPDKPKPSSKKQEPIDKKIIKKKPKKVTKKKDG